MTYETLIVEAPDAGALLIRLNRPQALNALNDQLAEEMTAALDAAEAEPSALGSRVAPLADPFPTGTDVAKKIATLSPNAVMLTKEMVNAAYETPLSQGVKLERRLFHSLFAFDDQKEGMAAFIEKRPAKFTGR